MTDSADRPRTWRPTEPAGLFALGVLGFFVIDIPGAAVYGTDWIQVVTIPYLGVIMFTPGTTPALAAFALALFRIFRGVWDVE